MRAKPASSYGIVLRRSSADCGASAPARTASSNARTSCLFMIRYHGSISLLLPGMQGLIHHFFQRNAMLDGAGVAIFVFGLRMNDDAIEGRGLDADLAIGRVDGAMRAVENTA